jgi:RNA polymerase sigma factor (sigma-70 family)
MVRCSCSGIDSPVNYGMPSDSTLLERIAAGDPAAVEGCLSKYRGLVWSIARRFAANYADAEDAVQEVFIELWRHAGRFNPALASESTFIGTVARRRLIDRKRRQSSRPAAAPMNADLAAGRPEIDHLETLEEGQRARGLLEKLRPEQRRVIELTIDQGMTQQEIAEATRLPLGTVKTHARRGLMRLRELLESAPPRPLETHSVLEEQGTRL